MGYIRENLPQIGDTWKSEKSKNTLSYIEKSEYTPIDAIEGEVNPRSLPPSNLNISESFPEEIKNNLIKVQEQLTILRSYLSGDITITSGYRDKERNRRAGGKANSLHLTGQAADFKVNGMTPKQVYNIIENLIKSKKMLQGGLGVYSTWVHYDIRGTRARWRG